MARSFLGVGWKYPVKLDDEQTIALSEYDEDIKEAIEIILGTVKGERVMRPDFGCGIVELVFDPINTVTMNRVEINVREALTIWEPRIDVINVEVSADRSEQGLLQVSIDYRTRLTNTRFNLVYPFYLTEGS